MDFELIYDGTLDTVLCCPICGEEIRTSPVPPDGEDWEDGDARIEAAIEIAEYDHEIGYTYIVDLDERGCYRAHVEDCGGNTVYTVLAGNELKEDQTSIFEDGFMKDGKDMKGLTAYLKDLGIIPEQADNIEFGW